MTEALSSNLLIQAYARGLFPMAESRESGEIFWVDPETRGVMPLDGFHVPKRLRKTIRQNPFRITADRAFDDVIQACSEINFARGRFDSWINAEIVRAYSELHRIGIAHSVECWRGDELVGGIYGVALRAAFFGESMFSRATDASKIALVHMVARLKFGGYRLFDSQFVNDHLKQFNVLSVPKADFHHMLGDALIGEGDFDRAEENMDGAKALGIVDAPMTP
ncbi:MAG: leucyl/phenylalanyl-tRNA--protein transferase [Minwuia sp.]|uniref:leucyl/phenylalanyl-tRNA--protein transferase n=1 Tax=Minwuia sp. TaxID=2493630 RepID=UPI003A8BE0B0